MLAIVNTYGSTIARESDAVLYTHAGPEVAVASTKAFIAQIAACYLLGLYLAYGTTRQQVSDEVATYLDELAKAPGRIEEVLSYEEDVRNLARDMKDVTSVLFLGRHVGFPVALEGALKPQGNRLYSPEGFAAGELKQLTDLASGRGSSPSSSSYRPRAVRCCTRRLCLTFRKSRPVALAPSRLPRKVTTKQRSTRITSSGYLVLPDAHDAAGHRGAAAMTRV